MFIVRVFEIDTGECVKAIECDSERKAEKVADGLWINISDDFEIIIDDGENGS